MKLREEGEGTKVQSPSWPNLSGQGCELDPCLSVGAKGAESCNKRGQIQRPFHSDG